MNHQARIPCKYFQQGFCKFGDQCSFSHDTAAGSGGQLDHRPGRTRYVPKYPNKTLQIGGSEGSGGHYPLQHQQAQQPSTRRGSFETHSGRGQPQRPSGAQHSQGGQQQIQPEQVIEHDLQSVQVQWPFTSYGITTDWAVANNILFGVEYSPEELRLQAMVEWRATGRIDQYSAEVQRLRQEIDRRRKLVLGNPKAALDDAIRRAAPRDVSQQSAYSQTQNFTQALVHAAPSSVMIGGMHEDFELGHVPLEPPS